MKLFSPAKVNLFLRVLGKRSDGYHELASLFQAISLFDEITLKLAPEDRITCSSPIDGKNIVETALERFRQVVHLPFGVHIHISKNIPTQAGLGGGSGNAATALFGLNQLLESPLQEEQLIQIAGEVGSDVPFFFSTGSAYCTGRGEKIRSVPLPLEKTIWIVKPSQGLSTPAVYAAFQAKEGVDPETLLKGHLENTPTYLNDLEPPALSLDPGLYDLKHSLAKHCPILSGSGTAFFCVGGERPENEHAKIYETKPVRRQKDNWYEQ